jgi:hypothetical protein
MDGNALSVLFRRYSIPVILLVVGIVLIGFGISSSQSKDWMLASGLLAASGVLSIIYISGVIPSKIGLLIGIPVALVAVYVLYQMGSDVVNEENRRIQYEAIKDQMKQDLSDIKTAQLAYKDKYGKYAGDWAELVKFINTGTVKEVIKEGGVPNRRLTPEERAIIYGAKDNRALDYNMTEIEAWTLSKSNNVPEDLKGFVRDTIEVSFFERTFENKSYVDRRVRMGFPKFNADSLVYIPSSSKQFTLQTIDSFDYQGAKIPVIQVMGIHPMEYKGKRDTLMFGSLVSPNLSSNWD